ncbi:MAG: hypothetical protein ACFHWZ_03680 [Phycisphaerales bacterium]
MNPWRWAPCNSPSNAQEADGAACVGGSVPGGKIVERLLNLRERRAVLLQRKGGIDALLHRVVGFATQRVRR